MATELQDSLMKAIDYLINNRVQKIDKDQTITATIKTCVNSLTGQYQVTYNNGFIYAYAQAGANYYENQEVFVLVPEGDFTKRKLILGVASQVTEDDNITFVSSLINNYNMIGQNTIFDQNSSLPQGLHSYLSTEYILLYQRGDEEHSLLTFNDNEFANYIQSADALLIEASFMTRLPKAHRLAKNGLYGIQFVLAFADKDRPEEIKYVSYVLDSNSMTGNPFLYNNYTDQYAIFQIDTESFLYVDSIMIWEEGFVEQSDTIQADFWGADILVKDVEIYGLREISATNGDYTLRLTTPQGATFSTLESAESLSAYATVTYQNSTDVSDSTTYYWFAKDDRIDASSEEYNIYGGNGWRYLKDKGNNRTMTTTGSENRAYENIYTISAVYKEQVILKQEFVLYNDAAKRDIRIESNLGTTFSFDRGTPTMTCFLDGKSSEFDDDYPDEYFSFSWAKIDAYGNTTPLNVSYEDLERQYDEALEAGTDYSYIAAIRNKMIEMEGVTFDRNVLTYPIKNIDTSATFSCSVYLRETSTAEDFFIGSATITLQNEGAATPTDYYILIENGDQVFQYSESGVAPNSDRYQDPQEILPLECHFYDPAGLEVNPATYSVKWRVPLENTLIETPTEGMINNPATGLDEWYGQATYPLAIEDSYDYQAISNQVTCIVTYSDIEYQKDSDLFFTKVGENGTNGTDVVCKISPVKQPTQGLLAIITRGNQNPEWNNGQTMGATALQFSAYNRTELLNTISVNWTVSGGNGSQSRYMSVYDGIVTWNDSGSGHRNQIVRGHTSFEGQTYYAFYPIPVIDYNTGTQYEIIIDKTYTLKAITYNADGRNPLYNKNQGLFFSLSNDAKDKYIVFDALGGLNDNNTNAAISLSFEKNAKSTSKVIQGTNINENGLYYVYVTPDDVYDGAWCNNLIRARIYGSETEVGQNPEATIYMPIYMSLNTFGLASLNAWDGNHVEINEDENYILAPQIGAGYKDNNNRFTGVVMGTAQTYDQTEPDVGLLGYSEGKQSIFLDAETGNAIFGLPEDQASTNNQYTEGRIELVPGGESKIGMWTIGSRAIYNMTQPPTPIGKDEEGNIEFEDSYIGVSPDIPYKDYPVPDAQISIPPQAQGLILNANPAYISVKGMPLNDNNSNIEWEGANTTIKRGDSIEVELDPRKSSVFSIYRHTTWDGAVDTGQWRRYPMVGINANGQFYTNAIEDGESSMGIGRIGAFGSSAADDMWVGAQFAYQGTNIFKFFIPNDEDISTATRPVYITAGSTQRNEYPRDFGIYGKTISLYSNETNSTDTTSPHWLTISNDVSSFGHTNNYIQIPSAAGSNDYNFEIMSQAIVDIGFSGISTTLNNAQAFTFNTKTFDSTINAVSSTIKAVGINITGNTEITQNGDFNFSLPVSSDTNKNYSFTVNRSITTSASGTKVDSAQMRLGNNNTYLELNDSTVSQLYGKLGIDIESDTEPIRIRSNRASEGIQIDAIPSDGSTSQGYPYLHLTPQTGGTGDFILSSGHGTIQSKGNLGNNRAGIQITDGFATNWGIFVGAVSGTSNSIQATHRIVGDDWYFNSSHSWNAHGGTYNSQSLNQHLAWLYSLVSSAYYRADEGVRLAHNAQNRADSAYSLANSANNNANKRVSISTFNIHRHYLRQDIVVAGSISSNSSGEVSGINVRNIGANSTTGTPA